MLGDGWLGRWLKPLAGPHGLLRAGRFDEAERAFREHASARPRDVRAHLALGRLALWRDDLAAAEDRLSRVLALGGRNREAHALLAEVHYRRDEAAAAASRFEAAGRAPLAAKLRSFASRPPYGLEGPALVRIPFSRCEPLPIVEAHVNGGPAVPFLLDTGGGELILDAECARRAEARRFGAEGGVYGGGLRSRYVHGTVDSFSLGDLTVHRLPIQIMDLGAMGAALGEPKLAGIVGTVLFHRLRATIDYPGGQLMLRRKDHPLAESEDGGTAVPFRLAGDHYLIAEGRLNDGPSLQLLVDTGLTTAFACPPATLAAAGIDPSASACEVGMGGGGQHRTRTFDIAALSLGGVRRQDLSGLAGVFPPELESGLGFRLGGIVSHEFFLPFAVTFDFARMEMRLRTGA